MAAFRSRNEASRCKSISNDSDADGYNSETEEPRSKRPKKEFSGNRGAACYKTKFNKEWTKIYPFIWKGDDEYKFLCTICGQQAHMGRGDLERHISKPMHVANAKGMKSQATLNFQPVSSQNFTLTER